MEESQRDQLEIAALLHDIGVIGVPDHILLKPGVLDCDEAAVMRRSRAMSLEILRHSCTSPEILQIVENVARLVRRQPGEGLHAPRRATSRWPPA